MREIQKEVQIMPLIQDRPIVISAARRTPLGAFMGALASVPSPQLGATAISAALKDAGVSGDLVDEALMGCVLPAGLGQAPTRQAARAAGLPDSCGATTINKVCGSGMKSVMLGHDLLRAGSADVVVAGGMADARGVRAAMALGASGVQGVDGFAGLGADLISQPQGTDDLPVGKDVQVEVLEAYEPSPVAPIGEAYDLLEQVTAEVMPDASSGTPSPDRDLTRAESTALPGTEPSHSAARTARRSARSALVVSSGESRTMAATRSGARSPSAAAR